MTTQPHFSQRVRLLTSSAIREILKITERAEVISFAGGLPSPKAFPVEQMRLASERVFANTPYAALQYGPSEGYTLLRQWVAKHMASKGANISPEQVLITTGSQQALDLIGKVFIDEDSKVLVETPTYLGALQSFSMFQPSYVSLPADEHGIMAEAVTDEQLAGGRFIYCLPNFQNPTGCTMTVERRKALVEKAAKAGVPIVEDDPYGELRYVGEPLPSLLSMNPDGVIYMGSFSKILAPGMRLGYIIAPPVIYEKLLQAKQAADLHTPSLTQYIAYELVKDGFLDKHVPTIRNMYQKQAKCMLQALSSYFPESVKWTEPDGGMFLWVTLPDGLDSTALLAKAVERNVAFVPGAPFYANEVQSNTLRLSFVTVPEEQINTGIRVLADLIKEELAGLSVK